jgi:hypothetical protein
MGISRASLESLTRFDTGQARCRKCGSKLAIFDTVMVPSFPPPWLHAVLRNCSTKSVSSSLLITEGKRPETRIHDYSNLELLGIQSSEPLKRHLQSFSDEELLFVQSCAGILNLFFMALRKAMLTMKSRFPKGVQSKIPPMRTPKDTQRFSSPRCAMEDSYRH